MFNKDTLQQLSQLKTTIRSQRELFQGTIRTTPKRFGFVKLDDGREAFVDPEQMLRVLPDDRVEVEVVTNKKNQLEARLEKLISSSLTEFVGQYVRKGSGHFVEPDLPQFNRWLFIPPQERTNCAEGDLVHCEVIRHPFTNEGKAQVRVVRRIGKAEDPGIESRYIATKYRLPNEWTPAAQEQASSINWSPLNRDEQQEDLTDIPFVTIDAENTRDMDDAVYIEANENGWLLITAIADPTRHIEPDSPLGQAARERANTVYLLGQSISMLPVELAHDTYSLVPEQIRPALICRMQISSAGDIENYSFGEALIRSRHKLSYQNVCALLENSEDSQSSEIPETIHPMLRLLHQFALTRIEHRLQHALVMEERADYFYSLNDQKKIERIEKRERNIAHRMIEEAMLVTNICAGELFQQHPGYGIFSTHIGFRKERLADALNLITEDRPDLVPGDLTQLDNFQQLFKELRQNPDNNEKNPSLLAILQRMLQSGALSFEPIPHFGLGFNTYATITSPIRRYNDFYNHLAIKNILHKQPAPGASIELITHLQEQLAQGRQACKQLELWLVSQYLSNHIGSVHSGTIALVNSFGIGVRMDDIGAEGFVMLADKEANIKPAFDSRRFTLKLDGKTYQLDQPVAVIITAVDVEKRRVSLELVDSEMADRLSVWGDLPTEKA